MVLLGERVGADDNDVDLVDAGVQRALKAALIEDETDVGRTQRPGRGVGVQCGHHVVCVGHLRHPLGIDEAHGLDPPDARPHCTGDQLDLVHRAQDRRIRLESIAGRDLDDLHGCAGLRLLLHVPIVPRGRAP